VLEVGEGADERARAVSDWKKKKTRREGDVGPRRLTGRKRELGHAVNTGRMGEVGWEKKKRVGRGLENGKGREKEFEEVFLVFFKDFLFKPFQLFKLFNSFKSLNTSNLLQVFKLF
jgi:hypothetical protein